MVEVGETMRGYYLVGFIILRRVCEKLEPNILVLFNLFQDWKTSDPDWLYVCRRGVWSGCHVFCEHLHVCSFPICHSRLFYRNCFDRTLYTYVFLFILYLVLVLKLFRLQYQPPGAELRLFIATLRSDPERRTSS